MFVNFPGRGFGKVSHSPGRYPHKGERGVAGQNSQLEGRSILAQRSRGKDDRKTSVSKGKAAGRTTRVNAIKTGLDSGKYRVEPKKVADKMVEDAIREIRSKGH